MHRKTVTSSNIASIGYDDSTQTLEIEFHSGGIYQYRNVPSAIYEGIMRAGSHGKYFHEYIKDRYGYSRIA